MSQQSATEADLPPAVRRVSSSLRWWGNVGFWIQLVLGAVAAGLLAFGTFGLFTRQETEYARIENSALAFATLGLVALGISILLVFRYRRLARRLRTEAPAQRPSRASTLRTIRLGLLVSLVGIILTVISTETFVGVLLTKATNVPQTGVTVKEASQYVRAIDIVVVQSSLNILVAHVAGLATSLWLLYRITQ